MRVDSHTQIRQAMRVLIHTHISCRLLVEGSAPKPLLNTEFHSMATRSTNAFKGRNKSFHPIVFGSTVKQSGPWKPGWQNTTPFSLSATVATVATVLGVPLKTPSRPLRASRFTRLLQTQVLPPPCKSVGYAAQRAWFCSRTLPDVLPIGGWHSHSDVW